MLYQKGQTVRFFFTVYHLHSPSKMPTGNKGMINQFSNMVAPQVCGDTDSTWKIVKSKRCIKKKKKSNYDKNFPPLRMMKASTPTTKNNSKEIQAQDHQNPTVPTKLQQESPPSNLAG